MYMLWSFSIDIDLKLILSYLQSVLIIISYWFLIDCSCVWGIIIMIMNLLSIIVVSRQLMLRTGARWTWPRPSWPAGCGTARRSWTRWGPAPSTWSRWESGTHSTCGDISKYGHCPQVSSLNNEGYSKFSEVTFFTTSKEGNGNENVSYYTVQKIMFCHNIFSENYTKEAISTGSPASCNFMSGVLSLMTIIVLVISWLWTKGA